MIYCPKKNLTRGKDPKLKPACISYAESIAGRNETKQRTENTSRKRGVLRL
jgi:hypothetical protein